MASVHKVVVAACGITLSKITAVTRPVTSSSTFDSSAASMAER